MWFLLKYASFLLFLSNESFCTKILRGYDNRTSWVEAQNHCVEQGGDLLLVDNDTIQALDRCQLRPAEMFWEGRYNTFSSWVIHVGCVQKSASFIASSRTMTTPGSVECGEYCRENDFFGIEADICHCLGSTFSIQNERKDDIMCHHKCNKRNEPCGGTGFISVYKEVSSREVKPRADDVEPFDILCGLVECTPPRWNFYGYPCGRSLKGMCSDGSIIASNVFWDTAQENCWRISNNTLHGEQLLNDLTCAVNGTYENTPLWVQMRRDKVTRIVNGKSVVPESTCFGGMLNNDTFVQMEMDCSHTHVYVCVIDTSKPNCTDCPLNGSDVIPPCTTTTEATSTLTTEELSSSTVSSISTEDTVTTDTPVPVNTAAPQTEDDKSGVIAAGVVGGTLLLIIIIGTALVCERRKSRKKEAKNARVKSLEELGISNAGQTDEDKAQTVSLSADDISKDSTLLVRPAGQPSRQTDFEIHTNAAALTTGLEGSEDSKQNTDNNYEVEPRTDQENVMNPGTDKDKENFKPSTELDEVKDKNPITDKPDHTKPNTDKDDDVKPSTDQINIEKPGTDEEGINNSTTNFDQPEPVSVHSDDRNAKYQEQHVPPVKEFDAENRVKDLSPENDKVIEKRNTGIESPVEDKSIVKPKEQGKPKNISVITIGTAAKKDELTQL